jgi:hypothetical protein
MAPANAARVFDISERASTTPRPARRLDYEVRIIPIAGADVAEEDMLGAEAWYDLSPLHVAAAVDRDLSTSRSWLVYALGRAMDEG